MPHPLVQRSPIRGIREPRAARRGPGRQRTLAEIADAADISPQSTRARRAHSHRRTRKRVRTGTSLDVVKQSCDASLSGHSYVGAAIVSRWPARSMEAIVAHPVSAGRRAGRARALARCSNALPLAEQFTEPHVIRPVVVSPPASGSRGAVSVLHRVAEAGCRGSTRPGWGIH